MNQIIKIAWDLNDQTQNRYELVYQIAELAKRMIEVIYRPDIHILLDD